jgi:RNA polymerase sigma-70 factor (ECF subfamily)
LIDAAAVMDRDAREVFARRYIGLIRTYLSARWCNSSYIRHLEDAVQEVFLVCFGDRGPLETADRSRKNGFRPYMYGIIRNVARRIEREPYSRQLRTCGNESACEHLQVDESSLSLIYDRSWARCIMRQAAEWQRSAAVEKCEAALRRVELLRLRFQEELTIREIAARWEVDARTIHREYAKARREFKAALLQVIAAHHPGSAEDVKRECKELVALLR